MKKTVCRSILEVSQMPEYDLRRGTGDMVYSTLTRKNVCGQITEEFYVDEAYDTVGKDAFKKQHKSKAGLSEQYPKNRNRSILGLHFFADSRYAQNIQDR